MKYRIVHDSYYNLFFIEQKQWFWLCWVRIKDSDSPFIYDDLTFSSMVDAKRALINIQNEDTKKNDPERFKIVYRIE